MLEFDTPELKKEFEHQWEIISRGAVDMLPEQEFARKLLESIKNNKPLRVKQGLAAARAKGVKLGRPKGSRNRERILDAHRDEILKCLRRGVDLANTRKMINPELERPISYNSYKYFVQHDTELAEAWTAQRQG